MASQQNKSLLNGFSRFPPCSFFLILTFKRKFINVYFEADVTAISSRLTNHVVEVVLAKGTKTAIEFTYVSVFALLNRKRKDKPAACAWFVIKSIRSMLWCVGCDVKMNTWHKYERIYLVSFDLAKYFQLDGLAALTQTNVQATTTYQQDRSGGFQKRQNL